MKTIFKLQLDHVIDIITNSSSELFVLNSETKEIAKELIANVYPEYLNEYDELKHISELSVEELNNYMYFLTSPHFSPCKKEDYKLYGTFTFDELYEQDGNEKQWNGHYQYKLKNNITKPKDKWDYDFVTEENKEWVIEKLDAKNSYFLYSLDENPDWEQQERLMNIAERFHLG